MNPSRGDGGDLTGLVQREMNAPAGFTNFRLFSSPCQRPELIGDGESTIQSDRLVKARASFKKR